MSMKLTRTREKTTDPIKDNYQTLINFGKSLGCSCIKKETQKLSKGIICPFRIVVNYHAYYYGILQMTHFLFNLMASLTTTPLYSLIKRRSKPRNVKKRGEDSHEIPSHSPLQPLQIKIQVVEHVNMLAAKELEAVEFHTNGQPKSKCSNYLVFFCWSETLEPMILQMGSSFD